MGGSAVCLHPLVHAQPGVSITAHFADLRDPWLERTKAHDLATILVIAICAAGGRRRCQ